MSGTRIRIELNKRNVGIWLKTQRNNPNLVALLESEGKILAARAGEGFAVKRMAKRRNRPGVIVYPETKEAKVAQAREARLEKALGGMAR